MDLTLPENIKGLSSAEAKDRLKLEGYNELPAEKKRNFFGIILSIIKEPMIALLLACIAIYIILGDLRESIVLFFSVFFIIGIAIYQENKTEKALAALKKLASPQALVYRDGEQIKISSRELVREDMVLLNEGDRVPADGVVLWHKGLRVNESLLTGESVPAMKSVGTKETELLAPQGDNTPFVYSGTLVVAGQGLFIVRAIGQQTEIGRIGKILNSIEQDNTPLQKDFAKVVKYILTVAIILCISVVVLNILTAHDLLPSFLAGITLAMSILPEEFPVVLAVFLSIGAWRLSQHKILVRRLSAVEGLGAATVLCVDKTGTLTANKMKVGKVFLFAKDLMVDNLESNDLNEIIKAAALSSNRHGFDPLEDAIKDLRRQLFHTDIYGELKLVREYALTNEFLVMAQVWQEKETITIYAKGAPEAIMTLCDLDQATRVKINDKIKLLAKDGLRILAIASALETDIVTDAKDLKLNFLGLVGFNDPVRANVAGAIKECYRAGITVKIITGDYAETAQSIARQIGLDNYQKVIIGADFVNQEPAVLAEHIRNTNVFARMMPEYKLQIVSALKAEGQVVAMTGDGVNDGPALKAADIGVAMGKRGTDVARESADIVLLDDNFASLVSGVKEGRRIYDNLQRAVVYVVAVHIPIAALALIPIMLGWPLIFFPVHIMFLELVLDPVCSIVFEAETANAGIMDRKPRNSKKSILNRANLLIGFIQGLSILLFAFLAYYLGVHWGWSEDQVRTMAFATLVIADIFLILVNRSWTDNMFKSFRNKNKFLWPIIISATAFLLFAVYNPFMNGVFKFSVLSLNNWLLAIGLALCPAIIFELFKQIYGKNIKHR